MDPQSNTEVLTSAQELWGELLKFGLRLMQPWTVYQLIIIVVLAILCTAITRAFLPKCTKWCEGKEGIYKHFSATILNVHRRVSLAVYIVIAFSVVSIMQIVTWPSRSFFIGLSIELAFSWLLISIVTSLIKINALRKFATWVGWIIATLQVTDFLEPTKHVLESIAIEFGNTRLSLLTALTAIITLLALFIIARITSRVSIRQVNKIDDMSPSLKVLLSKAIQIGLYTTGFLL
ncbi:MAG: hypothetical protein IME92_07100, partial [Proteobacteria bacterium]|nr:hypothetical protein [Pseudomonadota bacterium]